MNCCQRRLANQLKRERSPELVFTHGASGLGGERPRDIGLRFSHERIGRERGPHRRRTCNRLFHCTLTRRIFLSVEASSDPRPRPCRTFQLSMMRTSPVCQLTRKGSVVLTRSVTSRCT